MLRNVSDKGQDLTPEQPAGETNRAEGQPANRLSARI